MLNQVQFGETVLDSSPTRATGTQAHTALCMMATCIVCWQNHFTSQLREPESGAVCSVVKHRLWGPFAVVSGVHWSDRKPHPGHSILADNICRKKIGFLFSCFPYICCWEELKPQPATVPQDPSLETQWLSRCTQLLAVWLQAAKSPHEGLLNKAVISSWRIPAMEV